MSRLLVNTSFTILIWVVIGIKLRYTLNIVVKENIPSAFNLEELALDNKSKEKAICDLCFVECQCLTTLKTHKLQQHQEGKNKLCMYCDYKNVIWDNLKAHIDANHDQHGEKKHLCDLCGKGFI